MSDAFPCPNCEVDVGHEAEHIDDEGWACEPSIEVARMAVLVKRALAASHVRGVS